jgi:membrane-associated phospholipid phosphatase
MRGWDSKSRAMSIQTEAQSSGSMPSPQRAALASLGLRRAAFLYFVSWIVGAQIVFAWLSLGGPLPGRTAMVWILFAAWPVTVTAAALATARAPRARPVDSSAGEALRWTAAGLAAYAYWAGSYFFVAWAVDPARVRLLPEIVEASIPLSPVWSLVYIGVHPFTMTPSLGITDVGLLRRHVLGQVSIVALSSIAWAAYPVAVSRAEIPADSLNFGDWVLATIYGGDPIINCLPSTHCAMAIYTASALWKVDTRLGAWAWATAAAIGASTLFTKEHYLVDVIAGFALGGAAALIAHRRPRGGSTHTAAATSP